MKWYTLSSWYEFNKPDISTDKHKTISKALIKKIQINCEIIV